MAFNPPDFNMTCDIWTGPWLAKVFRETVDCNLANGRRVMQNFQDSFGIEVTPSSPNMGLLLPAGTDIRCYSIAGVVDVVEVPSGSGRWYETLAIDDVSKGFPSEYRLAQILQISQWHDPVLYAGCQWPIPIP